MRTFGILGDWVIIWLEENETSYIVRGNGHSIGGTQVEMAGLHYTRASRRFHD